MTFQVVFFEGKSDILFNYPDTAFGLRVRGLRRRRVGDRGDPGGPGRRDHVQLQHPRARMTALSLLWTIGQAAAAGDRRDAGLPGLRHRHGGRLGGRDVRRQEHRHRDVDRPGHHGRALQHRVRWRLRAGRGRDPGRDRALQPDVRRDRSRPTSRSPAAAAPRARVRGVGAATAVAPDLPLALAQFRTDGATALAAGAWTNQTSVVLKFTMSDASPVDTLTPQVEIKPVGTAFTGAGLWTGSAVASTGTPVQGAVTVTGLANGTQYHWRARTRDAAGQTSGWVSFGANAETARDVGVDTAAPTGSIVVAERQRVEQDAFREPRPQVLGRQERLQSDAAPSGRRGLHVARALRHHPGLDAGRGRWQEDRLRPISGRRGQRSTVYSDTISLDTTGPVVSAVTATPNPFRLGQTTTIRFRAADAVSATCPTETRILDAAGRLVRSLTKTAPCPAAGAVTSVAWDGRNAAHALVPPGTYSIEIIATDLAGNTSATGRASVVAQ